jgi:ABC-type oligopeptide transport system ATPase subunit
MDLVEKIRREEQKRLNSKIKFLECNLNKELTFEDVRNVILELLVKDTGMSKEFFENASVKEVENKIGIPRYYITREPLNYYNSLQDQKPNPEFLFDVNLLYKK